MLRLGIRQLGDTGASYPYHDGIGLDFSKGIFYVRPTSGAVTQGALTSLFTFTGGNESMYRTSLGLLQQASTNTPRIEYGANGQCLGLLMEAARTNLIVQSQDFATSWTGTRASAANTTSPLAPDGSQTADALSEDGTAENSHAVSQSGYSFTNTTAYTMSIWVKAGNRSWVALQFGSTAFSGTPTAYFNVSAGTAGAVSGGATSSIGAYANGWYRCTMTATATASAADGVAVFIGEGDGDAIFSGLSQVSLYLWGAQLEAGAFASSYIPTTTGSVARTADRCIRTLGSEYAAATGTFVVTGDVQNSVGATPAIFAVHDNAVTGAEEMILYANAGARRWLVKDGGGEQGNVLAGSITDGVAGKMACVYTANDLDIAVNGTMSGAQDTSATLPTVTRLDLMRQDASAITFGHILTFDYYPTRLVNGFLTTVTS
jgi:hypothetical protein